MASEACKKCGNPLGEVKRTWKICNQCWNAYHRNRKKSVISELGGKCSKCGIDDVDVLKAVDGTVLCYNCHKKSKVLAKLEANA
jgi:uncharacterized Zn finger protein (UPF0148 family)